MDLAEVEGGRGEVQFAGRGGQAASGEPVKDLLQVPDAGFDGRSAALVEAGTVLGA